MHDQIKRLWAQTQLYVWPGNYYLIGFPARQMEESLLLAATACTGFSAVIKERDEISITLSEEVWLPLSQRSSPRAVGGPYRVITFDLNLDLAVCGYFAPAAVRLAEAGISIVPQCAYLKDHVLIQGEKIGQAVEVLQEMIAGAKDAG